MTWTEMLNEYCNEQTRKAFRSYTMAKFKVGDKVKAYDRQGEFVGIVSKVLDGFVYLSVEDEHLVGHQTMKYFYTQQCRKLVKKKRLEFWLEFGSITGLHTNMSTRGNIPISSVPVGGWTKVRECK